MINIDDITEQQAKVLLSVIEHYGVDVAKAVLRYSDNLLWQNLRGAFIWCDTEEGHAFWNEVFMRTQNG